MFRRPELHFTPSKGWINDPNGLIQIGDRFHLFAQHNPSYPNGGAMHWLHATGDDLLHWKEEGIVLWPDEWGMMFSGSAVQLDDGRIALMYTAHGESETQGVAFSADGFHFEKAAENPVIPNPGLVDYRDPKVFRNPILGGWSVVLAAGKCLEFLHSENLIHWEKTGEFAFERCSGTVYECPDCFPLTAPDGSEKWIISMSMWFPDEYADCRMLYAIGEFDGRTFTTPQKEPFLTEVGYDSYAGVTYFGTEERIFVSWLTATTRALPFEGYCGCHTLAKRLSLKEAKDGLRLAQSPVLPEYAAQPIASGATLPKKTFVLEVEADEPFELTLTGENEEDFLRIALNEKDELKTERSVSPLMTEDGKYNLDSRRMTVTPRRKNGPISLKVVCDSWIVEMFADDGLIAHGLLCFARDGFARVSWTGAAKVSLAEV